MAYRAQTGGVLIQDLPSYGVQFCITTASGVGIPGLVAASGLHVYRAKNGESPATQIVTSGAGRVLVEVDATEIPGLYALELTADDLDTPGVFTLRCVDTVSGGDDALVTSSVLNRSSVLTG